MYGRGTWRRVATRIAWVIAAAAAASCSAGSDSDGFGSFGPGSPTSPVSGGGGGGSDSGSGGATDGATDGGTGAEGATTGGVDPTAAGSTSGDPGDSSGDGMGGSTDGGPPPPPNGAQPNVGMYAHCLDPAECTAGLACISGTFNGVANGFCAGTPCNNAALDCDPAPAGTTVTPICTDLPDAAMNPVTLCALDCSNAACPTGMDCLLVAFLSGDFNVCV
jgi:hypothetical protein